MLHVVHVNVAFNLRTNSVFGKHCVGTIIVYIVMNLTLVGQYTREDLIDKSLQNTASSGKCGICMWRMRI